MSDIYNKNAREKALLEEAYGSIYTEGQIDWSKAKKGGKPAIQAYKDEFAKHRKFKGPEGSGTSAEIPPGEEYQKDVDKLLARGYTEEESREERADVDRYEYEQGKDAGESPSLVKYVAEIAEDIITDNPDEDVPPEVAFDSAVETLQIFLGELKFEDVEDHISVSAYAEADKEAEDAEGWGNILKGAAISSLLGRGAIPGGVAGAAYDALKDKPKKKKEEKKDNKGGWF
tara:strand:- start:215 stop:904 length:690 start_codon:yes stop_codon:yes gene_type:complete